MRMKNKKSLIKACIVYVFTSVSCHSSELKVPADDGSGHRSKRNAVNVCLVTTHQLPEWHAH